MIKKELRSRIRQLLKDYTPEQLKKESDEIQECFLASEDYRNAKKLFVYIHMPKEPATDRILEQAWADGKEVYVPKCYPDHTMIPVRIHSRKDLKPGMLDIPEPVRCEECAAPGEIDLAVVPCMAATRDGKRLGHGAGYYDRFFAAYDPDGGMRKICLCFEFLLMEDIPTEDNDIMVRTLLLHGEEGDGI